MKKLWNLKKTATHGIRMKVLNSFGSLKGLQVMGTAGIVEPFSDEYNAHAAVKKIPPAALQKLNPPMNLLKIRPVSADFLNSDFKQDGFDSRQHLEF